MLGLNQRDTRRGISLLEVLISIGVLAIGLLGVVALIPAASQQAEEGARNDAGSLAGRRAAREFFVRGMGAAENWAPVFRVFPSVRYNVTPSDPNNMGAFCLDPFAYASANMGTGTGFNATGYPAPLIAFPPQDLAGNANAPNPGKIYLPRTTLQEFYPSTGNTDRWSISSIEEVFQFQDDLEFQLPERSTETSVQTMLKAIQTSGSQPQPAKRYAKGDFSWFATLVPVVSNGVTQGAYNLSIAIVRDRTPQDIPTVVRVRRDVQNRPQIFTFGGMGEIELESSIDVRPGEWIMLMNGRAGIAADPIASWEYQYEWYRVIASDGIRLTVAGDEWFRYPDPNTNQLVTIATETLCVVQPRVVAVYSRPLPLQYSN